MIVQKDKTDLLRAGFFAALIEDSWEPSNANERANAKYPYMTERTLTIGVYEYKVLAEDEAPDRFDDGGYAAGTFVSRYIGAKRPGSWTSADAHVRDFTPDELRKLADLLERPLEPYVEEPKPVPAVEA
jgi:hypothetical protein